MNATPDPPPAVRLVSRADFPSRFGDFEILGFEHQPSGEPFVVLARGRPDGEAVPLLRIHSQCLTGDALGSRRCDCGYQLQTALRRIEESGCGLLIYQLQEGRGIGILNKLLSYQLQDRGADTVEANEMLGFEADLREYAACGEILRCLGVGQVRLLSNNPSKIRSLEAAGIRVADRIPLEMPPDERSSHYLKTKKDKMGHLLDQV